MAKSAIKLYHFEGGAEVARLILVTADKTFEDIVFGFKDWPKYKPIAPFGQAPMLDVDGKIYGQSPAISTFLAREFGFHGNTNLECLKIDQVMQLVEDFTYLCLKAFPMKDGPEKTKVVQEVKDEQSPKFLVPFEQLLKENGTGYFVGDRLTVADLSVFDVMTGLWKRFVKFDDQIYPCLKKNVDIVRGNERIGPYMTTRKESPY